MSLQPEYLGKDFPNTRELLAAPQESQQSLLPQGMLQKPLVKLCTLMRYSRYYTSVQGKISPFCLLASINLLGKNPLLGEKKEIYH